MKTLAKNKNLGPDTQKHLSPTYLSAVHVTAVKTTYFIRECILKTPTKLTLTYVELKF